MDRDSSVTACLAGPSIQSGLASPSQQSPPASNSAIALITEDKALGFRSSLALRSGILLTGERTADGGWYDKSGERPSLRAATRLDSGH